MKSIWNWFTSLLSPKPSIAIGDRIEPVVDDHNMKIQPVNLLAETPGPTAKAVVKPVEPVKPAPVRSAAAAKPAIKPAVKTESKSYQSRDTNLETDLVSHRHQSTWQSSYSEPSSSYSSCSSSSSSSSSSSDSSSSSSCD